MKFDVPGAIIYNWDESRNHVSTVCIDTCDRYNDIESGTALFLWWKKGTSEEVQLIDRSVLKTTLIKLRKRAYSTLREIAFIVNHIRTLEGDL